MSAALLVRTRRVSVTAMRPVLLLELNEVHWRTLDRARERKPGSALETFVARAMTRTTHATGPLAPWITWPSLHRGMSSEAHAIQQLGQDIKTFRGTPIWDDVRARHESIGICGSMQSWPPIDPGDGGFYVPDTFARDDRCVPAWVDPVQRLNLGLVRESGRVRTKRVPFEDALGIIPVALRGKISPRLVLRLARQLVSERRDPSRVALRPTFQALLFWDVFETLFDRKRPPALSTFFTNHVASVLHRDWDALFPEDFEGERARRTDSRPITFALDVLDELIERALGLQSENADLIVVIASSMGQGAVHRAEHDGREVYVRDVARLLARIGVPSSAFSARLAMVPQVAVEVPDATWRVTIERELTGHRAASGDRIFGVLTRGTSVSITLVIRKGGDIDASVLTSANGSCASFGDLGLGVNRVPAGTGNHIPEGSLAIVGRGIAPDASRPSMPLTDVKALLLALMDLEA